MIKLSVIVPVYNVEDYIEECIKSLVKQDIKDMEIIVVDDGCKDNSINLVSKYNDKRIKIVHKKNGGLSSARNYGLKFAKGNYIAFVDSDDFIGEDKAFSEMCKIGEKYDSDIVVGNAIWYYSRDKQAPYKRDKDIFINESLMSGDEFIIRFMKNNCMLRTVWCSIYKRELLLKNELLFKEGILHEDELFTPQVFLKAKRVSIYAKDFYMYRQREGSIMNSNNNVKRRDDMLNICEELNGKIKDISSVELKKVLGKHICNLIINTIYLYKMKNVSPKILDILRNNSYGTQLKIKISLLKTNTVLFWIVEKIQRHVARRYDEISNRVLKVL